MYLARCHLQQLNDSKQEQEVVPEVYLAESSRSVVTRAREINNNYKPAMRKVARVKVRKPGGGGGGSIKLDCRSNCHLSSR